MILAPMQGLTEVLFRRVYERCFPKAIRLAVSPFISLTHGNLADAWKKIGDILPENNVGSIPVVPQILGKEPEEFAELANRMYDIGYDEVNWNMGCPMRKVAGKHRGSGLLQYPDEVEAILDKVMPRLKPRLSVKVRLGWKDSRELFTMVPILNGYSLASVTVHPRLGRQQYGGVPDMECFGRVLPLIKAPVIYNGDICTAAQAQSIREQYPAVADIMIGRGVLYNPMLPLDIIDPARDHNEDKKMNAYFVGQLMEEVARCMPTPEAKLRKTKEYWSLVWKALGISEARAREVLRAEKYTIVEKMITSFLQ